MIQFERPEWHLRANCRTIPGTPRERVDLMFPVTGEGVKVAQVICTGCPVQPECLWSAIDEGGGQHGVWGGKSERARRQMMKEMGLTIRTTSALEEEEELHESLTMEEDHEKRDTGS